MTNDLKALLVTGLELLVDTPATANVSLEIGAVSEVVTVQADAVLLNTTDATVGNAFNETKVRQLPLLTRNVVELMSLQPGNDIASGADRGQNFAGLSFTRRFRLTTNPM